MVCLLLAPDLDCREMTDDPFEIDTFDTFEDESEESMLILSHLASHSPLIFSSPSFHISRTISCYFSDFHGFYLALLLQQKRDAVRKEIEDLLEMLNHVQLTSQDIPQEYVHSTP
jgi:hypothetical protein